MNGDETVDSMGISNHVTWCTLMYVGPSGANIIARSPEWQTINSSAFSYIHSWTAGNVSVQAALNLSSLYEDMMNKPTGVIVKGIKMLRKVWVTHYTLRNYFWKIE